MEAQQAPSPLYELLRSNQLAKALTARGVTTKEELLRCRQEDLLRMPRIGRRALTRIRQRLAESGLSLRDDPPPRVVLGKPPEFSEVTARRWHVNVENDRSTPDMAILGSGVYFLCLGAEVVYVGQATCIAARVATHLRDKHFDNFWFRTVPEADLNRVERRMIAKYDPRYNIQRPSP